MRIDCKCNQNVEVHTVQREIGRNGFVPGLVMGLSTRPHHGCQYLSLDSSVPENSYNWSNSCKALCTCPAGTAYTCSSSETLPKFLLYIIHPLCSRLLKSNQPRSRPSASAYEDCLAAFMLKLCLLPQTGCKGSINVMLMRKSPQIGALINDFLGDEPHRDRLKAELLM